MKFTPPPPLPQAELREAFRRAMIEQPGIHRVKHVAESMGIPLTHAKEWERQFRDDSDYVQAINYAALEELDRRKRLEHRTLRAMEMTIGKLESVVRDGTWDKHFVKLEAAEEKAAERAQKPRPILPRLAAIRDSRIADEAAKMESRDRIAAAGKLIAAYQVIVNANREFEEITVQFQTPRHATPAKARELVREIFGSVTPDDADIAGRDPAGNPTH